MNQRIRELNMQAAEYATSVCPSHSRDWYPIQNTKFAELIIKETLQVARAGIEYGDGMEDAVYKYFEVES